MKSPTEIPLATQCAGAATDIIMRAHADYDCVLVIKGFPGIIRTQTSETKDGGLNTGMETARRLSLWH